jgi:hypothetical protein
MKKIKVFFAKLNRSIFGTQDGYVILPTNFPL